MALSMILSGTGQQSNRLIQSFGLAALLIIAGVLSTWVYLKRSGLQEALTLQELELLTLSPISVQPAEDGSALDEVDTWIQFGEEAYAAGRVIEPVADNALYYYQKALAQVPEHAEARAGLDRVIRHLVSGTESAIFRSDWVAAREYSEKFKSLAPDDPRATAFLNRINRFEQLENLVARANRQVAAARLTEPPGDNALQTYRRILEIEPTSSTARQGIASIIQRLLGVAQSAALAGEQARAQDFINRVKRIDPDATGIAETEQLAAQWTEIVNNRNITEQLEAASAALQAGRLVGPDNANALALFESVMALDPASDAARQGKRLVQQALVERAWTEIRASRFSTATATIEQARDAGAESFALVELEDELLYSQALAAARRGEFDRVYAISDLQIRRRDVPVYPRTVKGDGWVSVRFTVAEDGNVVDAVVEESSNEAFNDAALNAISRWTFKPQLLKGRPIPVRAGARFAFKE